MATHNIEKYKELIKKNYTTKQIALELGMGWTTVKRYLKQIGLRTNHWKEPYNIDKETLTELVNKNYSSHRIAKELKCSQTNVRHWLKKYGLNLNARAAQKVEQEKGLKTCPQCKRTLARTKEFFYINKSGACHSWCKKCNDVITWGKQKDLKKKSVEYKGGKCCICGYNKYVGALDFHHVDPSQKEFNISRLRLYTWERVKMELDKCVCVCKNCHAELHGNVTKVVDSANPDIAITTYEVDVFPLN